MEKKRLTTEEYYRQRVDREMNYIRLHLDREIDIRTLAELSAFSPFHFHRIMRGTHWGIHRAYTGGVGGKTAALL